MNAGLALGVKSGHRDKAARNTPKANAKVLSVSQRVLPCHGVVRTPYSGQPEQSLEPPSFC